MKSPTPATPPPPPSAWALTFDDTDWRFLSATALVNALTDVPAHEMVCITSAPSEEEKATKRVMDALGELLRQGVHPPMGWYRTPEDPRRPFLLITEWYATVLHRPEDGLAVLIKYPRRDEESAEQLVQRCLCEEDGSMHLGRLTCDGRPMEPWMALNADRLIAWNRSPSKDLAHRHGLADLSASLHHGGLRKAYQVWEQAQLREAAGAHDIVTWPAPTRRL